MIKKTVFIFYVVLIVVMAAATIIEHFYSTPFASQYIWCMVVLPVVGILGGCRCGLYREVPPAKMEPPAASSLNDCDTPWRLPHPHNRFQRHGTPTG